MIPKFTGTVIDGKISFFGRQRHYLENWLATLEGEKIVVQVKKWEPEGTDQQMKYMHAVVFRLLSQHTGFTEEEIKEAMKIKFASKHDQKDGLTVVESVRKMSISRRSEFIEDICRWAATDLDLYIPPPIKETTK